MAVQMPVDFRALYDAGKRLKKDREKPVRLAVVIEVDAPDELVEAARAELHPKTAAGIVDVAVVEAGTIVHVDPKADAALVLVGSGTVVAASLKRLREHAVPTVVVALRAERGELARLLDHPETDVVVGEDPAELIRGPLADWIMERLEPLRTALGHNFEFVRRSVAKEAVRSTSWQNAAIGAAVFLPGADMPLLTLNQGKMLLQIAAAYGQQLDAQRAKELAAVVAGGFLFRSAAREVVGIVPGFGWALKGGIAYSGTTAMGLAAIRYFEQGGEVSGIMKALAEGAGEAAARVSARAHLGRRPLLALDDESVSPEMGPGDIPEPEPRPSRSHEGYTVAASCDDGQPALLDVPPAPPTFTVTPRADQGPMEGPGL